MRRRAYVARRSDALSIAALGVVAISVAYTASSSPGQAEGTGLLLVSVCTVLGLLVRPLRPVLWAVGGGVAVALTSRDFFSFWPAASALLIVSVTSSTASRKLRLVPAAVASVVGLVVAASRDLTPALLPVAVAAAALLLVQPMTALVSHARELQVESDNLRARALENEEQSRELERRTALARELHDTIGHSVTAMVVQAEAASIGSPNPALDKISDLGRSALQELDEVLFGLRNVTSTAAPVDLGLIDVKLAEPLRLQGLDVHVVVDTDEADPETRRALYRAVQEALTNVMRHANASEVSVGISQNAGYVVARITDNGDGLPPKLDRGSGLKGIDERVRRLQGVFTIAPNSPHGTVVEVSLPRKPS